MKFRFQKIDLESKTTYTCHAAAPHAVDFAWLADNPGSLHNTATNITERQMMLDNIRNPSCEQNCWQAEDKGAVSPRIYQNGTAKTHTGLTQSPEIVDITIGGDCNLTCTYCCKEFSSSWRRDLVANGNYQLTNDAERYKVTAKDKVLLKISQTELKKTHQYQLLLDEAKLSVAAASKVIITGGEPFLDNSLVELVLSIPQTATIEVYSGLGVDPVRFAKIVDKIKQLPNLEITVSAEATGALFEFNRYGVSWDNFLRNVSTLDATGVKYKLHSVITNLTVFGFVEFYKQFAHKQIEVTFAYQPLMQSVYVLDNDSKTAIGESVSELPSDVGSAIIKSIEPAPTQTQIADIGIFLREFAKRRPELSLDIFPTSFLNWTNNVV